MTRRTSHAVRPVFAVLFSVLLIACGDSSPPGNADVYERIENMTNCLQLQSEFNTAMDNAEARQPGDTLRDVSLAYAKAADERIQKLGC